VKLTMYFGYCTVNWSCSCSCIWEECVQVTI